MSDREREIGNLLDQLVSQVRRDMGRHTAELGLSRFDFAVLHHLYYDRVSGLASSSTDSLLPRLEMARGQLNDVLDALVARGLAESVWGQGFRLTAEGVRVSEPLITIGDSIMLKATSGLTRDEIDRLADVLSRMCDNVGAPRTHVG